MPTITIRDVPEQTRDELASRAALSGRSLQEYLKAELIALAEKPDVASLLARVQDRKAVTRSQLAPKRILMHRDSDRR